MMYEEFLQSKRVVDEPTGLEGEGELMLHPMLFPFQRDIVRWALRRGRAAVFADCGMGKTLMQLEWARHVPGRVLIVAPLAVAQQTVREGEKIGVRARYSRGHQTVYAPDDVDVTNYEMLHRFRPEAYVGVVLDESSILKSYTGKFRNMLIEEWGRVPFRLCATATPAPNDFMELGNHAEFLGSMTRVEMLSQFFVHDGGETQKWRLKGHAEEDFWRWLCSWAVMVRKPSDLGYEDQSFVLPPLRVRSVVVDVQGGGEDTLFAMEARTMSERRSARRGSIEDRVRAVAELVNGSSGPWVVWCDLNAESEALCAAIDRSLEVRGSHSVDEKERRLRAFQDGECRVMVTKPSIAGWGLNWQHCHQMAFTGLSDSYEQFYQAVRRCWRFGQTRPVDCYVVTASTEGAVVKNIERKEADAMRMAEMMLGHMRDLTRENVRGAQMVDRSYAATERMEAPAWM